MRSETFPGDLISSQVWGDSAVPQTIHQQLPREEQWINLLLEQQCKLPFLHVEKRQIWVKGAAFSFSFPTYHDPFEPGCSPSSPAPPCPYSCAGWQELLLAFSQPLL